MLNTLVKMILTDMEVHPKTLHMMRQAHLNDLIHCLSTVLKQVLKHEYVFPEFIRQVLCAECPDIRNPYAPLTWTAPAGYVDDLKKVFQPEQRSPEWYAFRKERLTASDIGTVLGKNHYSKPKDILLKKCGYEKPFYMSPPCAHGVKYEPIATFIYEKRQKMTVHEFGCLAHPVHPFIGASPDGICSNGVMLEIKNPYSRKIVGIPPIHYWIQMQIQLEVCDLELCDFLECSYAFYDTHEELKEGELAATHGNAEFGPVIEYYVAANTKEARYRYCPLGITVKKMHTWIADTMKDIHDKENCVYEPFVTWWALKTYSLVRVRRDTAWFAEALPQLRTFWEKVIKQRVVGIEALVPKPKKKRKSVCKLLVEEETKSAAEVTSTPLGLSTPSATFTSPATLHLTI